MSTEHNKQAVERFDALLGATDLSELDEALPPSTWSTMSAPIAHRGWPAPASSSRRKGDTT